MNIDAYNQPAFSRFARDLGGTVDHFDFGNILQRNQCAAGSLENDIFKCPGVVTVDLGVSQHERKTAFAIVYLGCFTTTVGNFNDVIDIFDIQTVTSNRCAVDGECQIVLAGHLFDSQVGCTINARKRPSDLTAQLF